MLYVTTRDDRDAFTAHRALHENRSSDGGLYLPFRFPVFAQEDLEFLLSKPFNACTADVLNLLFQTKLTGWDLDFSIGRKPLRLKEIGHKVIVAEVWHNPDWNFERLVKSVANLLSTQQITRPGSWAQIGIRAAVLFGIFAELKRAGFDQSMDISVVSGDFCGPMSALYAKQWGLPVGNIVCCCNENSALWDLICHGQMRTDGISIPTSLPEADVSLPENLERLIYGCGGAPEVERYLRACRKGRMYTVDDVMLEKLRRGLFVSVVSSQRATATIPNVYRTRGYLLSPYAALSYAGLQDYRARTGETLPCIVFSERSPVCDRPLTSKVMGISENDLENYL